MDCTILEVFRHNLYHGCLRRAADALFDLADALLTDTQAGSFAELSQAASFQRAWPSLYEALEDGQIDRPALLRLFAAHLPRKMVGERLVLGLDVSSILRPDAHTAADRTLVHRSNLPKDATPVGPGWQFSALVVLPDPVSSWTYILDTRRVPSSQTASSTGSTQLSELLPLLLHWQVPLLTVLDRGYANAPWVLLSHRLPSDQLIRARKDQVLYRPAPPRTKRPGQPRKDGSRFKGSDPSSHGPADADWSGLDAQGHPLQVSVWGNLHLRKARQVAITVVRVIRSQARDSKRDPRVSWFWWIGGALPPLCELPRLYARRFGQEHGFRFDKQDLLWARPCLRTPAQFERWSDLVSLVHNQLVLARPIAEAVRRPWERADRQASPRQVRRAMARIIGQLGTPARRPQRRGKAPGRAVGATVKPAIRHPVIRKGTKTKRSPKKTTSNHQVLRQ
jgi:hypothetical protein